MVDDGQGQWWLLSVGDSGDMAAAVGVDDGGTWIWMWKGRLSTVPIQSIHCTL